MTDLAVRDKNARRQSLRVARWAARVRSDVVLAGLDAVMIGSAYAGTLLLRFDGHVPDRYWSAFRVFLPFAIAVSLVVNWTCGLYGQMWRYASVREARRVLAAGLASGVVITASFMVFDRQLPLSMLLGTVAATMLVGGLRFQSRLFAFRRSSGGGEPTRVVVIGAGQGGGSIVREMLRGEFGQVPVVLLDDDPRTHGRRLAGVPIIGGLDELQTAVDRYGAQQALLAIPSADAALVRRVADAADVVGLPLKVLPGVVELLGGRASVRDVRDLSIDDLLGRQQVSNDLGAVSALLRDRRVLITGAGGSIGSEIARQVAACEPATLLLLDHDETHLYEAAQPLHIEAVQLLADIRDRQLIDDLFALHRPQVVFHAAAHKHVPLLERHGCEAAKTNVFGTRNVVDAARRHGVERLVFISTDKAVHPTSVMGASKRIGEQIVLTGAGRGNRPCAVRFGNVLGSRGSVIPTFMRQIADGGPVTVTDPRMTRFFMSIPEAVQLVLEAATFSRGGEIFMLDMGEPVRILDLAKRMIRLCGKRVDVDIPIVFTGVRPGEKLHEELHAPDEVQSPTQHPSVVSLRSTRFPPGVLAVGLERLERHVARRDDAAAASELLSLASPAPVEEDVFDIEDDYALYDRTASRV